jgi:hypothetical protein
MMSRALLVTPLLALGCLSSSVPSNPSPTKPPIMTPGAPSLPATDSALPLATPAPSPQPGDSDAAQCADGSCLGDTGDISISDPGTDSDACAPLADQPDPSEPPEAPLDDSGLDIVTDTGLQAWGDTGATDVDDGPPLHSGRTIPDGETGLWMPRDSGSLIPADSGAWLPRDSAALIPADTGAWLPRDSAALIPADTGAWLPRDSAALSPTDTGAWLPRDSAVLIPVDSGAWLPRDSAVLIPVDSGAWPPQDSAALIPADSGVWPPQDSAALEPADSAAWLPRDSALPIPADSAARPPRDSALNVLEDSDATPDTAVDTGRPRTGTDDTISLDSGIWMPTAGSDPTRPQDTDRPHPPFDDGSPSDTAQ